MKPNNQKRSDRIYMNYQYQRITIGFGRRMTPGVKFLLITNIIVFLGQYVSRGIWVSIFGLIPYAVIHEFAIWQVATYMFLHGSFMHIFFNMFFLWMFGTEVEQTWGTREFLKYYFICGIGAGILTVIFNWNSVIPSVGASGAIFGLMLAFALLFPNRTILIWFLFPMKAKHFILFFALIEIYSLWALPNDGIGHLTHIGGLLIGYIYLKKYRSVSKIIDEIRWRRARRGFHIVPPDEEEREDSWNRDDDDPMIH